MKASFALFTLSLLLLFARTFGARKDTGVYWRAAVKDQSMPAESSQIRLHADATNSVDSHEKAYHDCHTSENSDHKKEKHFFKDFEPVRPDISIYDNDVKPKEDKSFAEDFETKPGLTIYDNGIKLTQEKSFFKDFETRPYISVYDNQMKPTDHHGGSFSKDFESKPDVTIYHE